MTVREIRAAFLLSFVELVYSEAEILKLGMLFTIDCFFINAPVDGSIG